MNGLNSTEGRTSDVLIRKIGVSKNLQPQDIEKETIKVSSFAAHQWDHGQHVEDNAW
jgi:hypothetical protein